MFFDRQRVRENVRAASTEDLLDRVTAFRAGMEPDAIPMIEEELRERGIGPLEIHAHLGRFEDRLIRRPDGSAAKCSLCRRPAVVSAWGWFKLWRRLPLFPWKVCYCTEHAPKH